MINYNRFLELSEEFGEFLESLHTLYLDSIVGFKSIHQRILDHQKRMSSILGDSEEARIESLDECGIDYEHLCGEKFYVESESPLMKEGKVKQRTALDGTNYVLMGRLVVVYAYSYWEDYLREEIAVAAGVLDPKKHTKKPDKDAVVREYVPDDFWGDMRLLRHAILHNQGKATSDLGKARILKWFKPGEPVNLDFEKMKCVFRHMGDCRIALGRLSLPPHNARFPTRP